MTATQAANVTFRDLEAAATLAVKGAATVGQIDVVSITIDDGDTTGSEDVSGTAGVLTLANVETLNVNAVDDAEITQSAAASGSLNSVTLTGSGNHTFTTGNMAQGNFNLNASATTAANTLDASTFATNGIAIQGGSGVDTITGSSQADAITGNAGNDIINNQATSAVATAAADVLTGGAGDDTFTLTGSIASTTVYTGVANVTDFTVATTASGSDKIRFAAANNSYAAGLSVDGTAAGASGAVVVLNVAQSAGATDSSADAIAENFIKLTQSVAFDTNNQTTFNNAIGTSTVTNMTAGTYAASFHDATNNKMVLVEVVTTATAATTLQTGDAVRLIATIDMTAADYANIDADNFANFV
jgi:Ca2+-binding RTX toxin-like protein